MGVDYEKHYENGNLYYSVIYAHSTYGNGGSHGWASGYDDDKTTLLNKVSSYTQLGYYLIDVEITEYGKSFSSLYST